MGTDRQTAPHPRLDKSKPAPVPKPYNCSSPCPCPLVFNRCICGFMVSWFTVARAGFFFSVTLQLSACDLEHLVCLSLSIWTCPDTHQLSGRGGCLRPFQDPNSKGPVWLRFPTTDVFWPKRHVGLSAILWHQLDVVVMFSFQRAPCPKGKNKCKKGQYTNVLWGWFGLLFFESTEEEWTLITDLEGSVPFIWLWVQLSCGWKCPGFSWGARQERTGWTLLPLVWRNCTGCLSNCCLWHWSMLWYSWC